MGRSEHVFMHISKAYIRASYAYNRKRSINHCTSQQFRKKFESVESIDSDIGEKVTLVLLLY